MKSCPPPRAALFIACASLCLAAGAQDAAPAPASGASAPNLTLQPVTVTGRRTDEYTVKDSGAATKLTLTPRETPQSMTVFTRERLDDQNTTSLRQVLDNTPGIYSTLFDTERVVFYSRGFRVDTLMYDGVPALSSFDTGSIDETLDSALYERIEIVRGATGLMTGAGSPAASINLVRKHADSRTPTASLDFTIGSFRDRRVEFDGSTPLTADGRIRGRVVAVAEDAHSYQSLYRKKHHVLSGVVDADVTRDTRASVGFDFQDGRPRSVTWGSFPMFFSDGTRTDWPRSVSTAVDWSYWNRRTQTVFGELRHQFDSGWSMRATLSHRRFTQATQLLYLSGFPDPADGTGLDASAYQSRNRISENALDVYATGPFELLGRKHELVAGYNGSRAHNVGTENEPVDGTLAPVGNFFAWNGSYPEPEWRPATLLSDISTTQDAVYGAARFSLTDTLKLITGARLARWKADSFYVYDSPVDSNYSFSKAIPYAGAIWDVSQQFSLFTSYTGIFKPQSDRDVNGRYLDPITGRSAEIGIKGEHFDKQLNTAFTLFDTRQRNVAAPALNPDGTPVFLGDGVTQASVAVPGTKTRGFEFEASGRLTPEWQGSFGWTRNVTRDGDTGETIRTFIPATLLRLFTTWTPGALERKLTLGGGMNWQSASSTTVASPGGSAQIRQGSVGLVSLMARYQFTPNLSLQLNANNVLNRKYYILDPYDNTSYASPASGAMTLRFAY